MKQRICVLLSVLLFVIAFTGCGKSDDKWIGKYKSVTLKKIEVEINSDGTGSYQGETGTWVATDDYLELTINDGHYAKYSPLKITMSGDEQTIFVNSESEPDSWKQDTLRRRDEKEILNEMKEQEQAEEQAELESRDLSKISEMSAAFKSAMTDPEYARYDVNVSSVAELKSQYPDLYTKMQGYLGKDMESYEEFESENCQGGTISLRKDDSGYHASVLKNGVVVVGKSGNRMEQ